MPSPAVMEQPYVVMDFIQLFTVMILVVVQESKKPEGRRRQNFLVVRRVARAFRLAVEHRDLFLAPSQCLMISYACRLLSLCCSKI